MVSEGGLETWGRRILLPVLILVLVEDGLRVCLSQRKCGQALVLILVLVEDGLRVWLSETIATRFYES